MQSRGLPIENKYFVSHPKSSKPSTDEKAIIMQKDESKEVMNDVIQ